MNYQIKKIEPFGQLIEATKKETDLNDINISELRTLFESEQLLVLRGFKSFKSSEELSNYCQKWGEISLWPFGKVLELVEHEKPEDHIFDNAYVPLHWDGMYREQVPEIQIFQCVSAPGNNAGGRTTFSNTAIAYNRASQKLRNAYKQVTGVYERKMEFYDSKTIAPLITQHPSKNFPVIRFCEPPIENDQSFLNHPGFELQGIQKNDQNDFLRDLLKNLYAPENFLAHQWKTGDLVISDNYTLLHGRESFTSGAPRHLRRVQVLGRPPLQNPHLVHTK